MVIQNGINKIDIYVIKTRFDITTLPKLASMVAQTKESACQCRRPRFNPWVRKIPQRREWLPTPGESHGQKSLAGSQRVGQTEQLTLGLYLLRADTKNVISKTGSLTTWTASALRWFLNSVVYFTLTASGIISESLKDG